MDSDYHNDPDMNQNSSSVGGISAKSKIIISVSIIGIFLIALIIIIVVVALDDEKTPEDMDHSNFVIINDIVPDIITELRYYSTFNFVGAHIDGYEEPVAILTKEAANKLKNVSDYFVREKKLRIKIWDSYRPQKAVDHFLRWSKDENDATMKEFFYPHLTKKEVFEQGFVATKSSHSRGSTVDLTLFDQKTGTDVDFGSCFDFFGKISWTNYTDISLDQINNRIMLKTIMEENGFKNLEEEWWHYTLKNEPYPNTYFNFPINGTIIKQ